MKVIFVTTRGNSIGGAQIQILQLCQALIQKGHEVIVAAGERDGMFHIELQRRNIRTAVINHLVRPINPAKDTMAVLELVSILRREYPDLVSLHTAKAGVVGRIASRIMDIPCVFTPHGWSVSERFHSWQVPVYQIVERIGAHFTAQIINVCEYERSVAIKLKIARGDKLSVIYNGILDIPEDLRADVTLSPPRVLMVGRMEPQKNHSSLIRALAELKGYAWSLEFVGDGPLLRSLMDLAASCGIANRVTFAGFNLDPVHAYARAQVFALCSHYEAFPYTSLEAMRAGLPVVVSRVGGSPEAVIDGISGFLVDPHDRHCLVHALRALIIDSALRKRMGKAGRDRFPNNFQFHTMLSKTLEVYSQVVRGRESFEPICDSTYH